MPVRSLEYVDVTMMTLCPRSSKHYAKLYMCISTPPSPGTKKSDTIAILSLRVDRTYRGILPCLLYRHEDERSSRFGSGLVPVLERLKLSPPICRLERDKG